MIVYDNDGLDVNEIIKRDIEYLACEYTEKFGRRPTVDEIDDWISQLFNAVDNNTNRSNNGN